MSYPTDAEIARDVRNAAGALNHRFGRTTAYNAIYRATDGTLDSVDPITNAATAVAAVDFFRHLFDAILSGSYHQEEFCTEEDCCSGEDSDEEAPEAADSDAATEAGDPADDEEFNPEDALAGLLVSALLKVLAPDDDSDDAPDEK